ncbi:GfV-B35-ORF1 [Ichnoviriform fumiferanae]|uniref:GfV-B35-ORF1 n=1 Tax=Ichnoviriform fumiferanae TaxID=419435 RepID=A2PZT2_9VIRU|nr:GfV-B35-ORF1 [Ichnoviriform fumiferanae]BAF45504.1 GfV-B35-ORF1 [Ichnoviriform fumiferanae]
MAQGRYGIYTDSWRWAEKIKLRIQRQPWNLEPYDKWAHYVNGCNTNEKFIVTPLPEYNNMNLFIDMMFQQKVNVVVIPGEIKEEQAINYCNYWNFPPKRDVPNMKYNLEQLRHAVGQTSTTIDIDVSSKENPDKGRLIRVFMYNNWPIDNPVPTNMHDFIKFIEEVNVANGSVVSNRETCNPIVVHSTEAGRAGVYCAIDIGMDCGAEKKPVWIGNIVNRVAQGRYTGGTTTDQNVFTASAIEYCLNN